MVPKVDILEESGGSEGSAFIVPDSPQPILTGLSLVILQKLRRRDARQAA